MGQRPYTVEEQMPAAGETHPQGGAVIVRLFGPPEGAPAPALSPIPGLAGPQGAPVPPVALTPPADDGTRETPPENGGEPAESDTTTVPSLAGLDSVAAMRSALQAAGLTGDFVAQKNDKKEQEFKFAGQSHAPGTTVPKGTTITVSIYEAVEEGVAVPNLAGLASVAEVRAALSAAGLGVSFAAADPPSKEQEFKFAGQSHAPGTMVPKGTTITVSIYQQFGAAATAQASGIVPNVVDQTLQGAVAMLQSAGLRLGGIEVSAKPPTREQANRVYAQTPAAGEPIPASKTVALKRYAEFTEQAAAPAPAPDGTGGFDRAPVGPESDFVGHFEGESILARERGQASARDRWDRAPNRNVGRIRIDITRTGGQWAMCTSTLPNCIGGASTLDSQGLHWQDGRGTSIDIKVAGSNLVGRMLMRSEGIGAGNFSEMLWTFTASRR
jgi:beta-lactam-binding protein with PASTA domain